MDCHSVTSGSVAHGLWPASLLCPWDFPGKNTGVGCHFLLQGIFPARGLSLGPLCLQRWQAHSFPRSHLGSSTVYFSLPREAHSVCSYGTPAPPLSLWVTLGLHVFEEQREGPCAQRLESRVVGPASAR